MARRIDTEILVVGGGPVGLTLAMDLAHRGVDVTVAEIRAAGEPPSARCNHVMRIYLPAMLIGFCEAEAALGLPWANL